MNPDLTHVPKPDGPLQAPAYDPARYGDTHAEVYDQIYAGAFPTDQAVRRLVELAATRPGPMLELGIGTGRLALPLYHAATLAGLELLERAGGWDHQPYDSATVDHVTIYHQSQICP